MSENENMNTPQQNYGPVSDDDKNMALILYLLSLVSGFIGPLIIWLLKKDESEFIDYHGKECLNLQITVTTLGAISLVLTVVLIGFLTGAVVGIYALVITIIAAMNAYKGEYYRIPLIVRFLK